MKEYVWDASAILVWLKQEPGVERLENLLASADGHLVSAVNLAEVAGWFDERGMPTERIREMLRELDIDVVPFDFDDALTSGLLRTTTRPLGLSLGDRACIATARRRRAVVVTADREWLKVDLGVGVECLRT